MLHSSIIMWSLRRQTRIISYHILFIREFSCFFNGYCYSPVWMYVCFFMSDFWWNLLPQYWHGYGLVSECMRRWVDNVLDLLKAFPHCLHCENNRVVFKSFIREIIVGSYTFTSLLFVDWWIFYCLSHGTLSCNTYRTINR